MEVMFETLLNPPEVTSTALAAPAAITRGSIADFCSATWDLVGDFLTDGGEVAYNFWEVWVDDKLQTNLILTWYRMGAQYNPRVHLKLKDSVAFSPQRHQKLSTLPTILTPPTRRWEDTSILQKKKKGAAALVLPTVGN